MRGELDWIVMKTLEKDRNRPGLGRTGVPAGNSKEGRQAASGRSTDGEGPAEGGEKPPPKR